MGTSKSRDKITSINPATGEEIKTYSLMDTEKVSAIIEEADQAFQSWSKSEFSHRVSLMLRLADLLEERKENYGELMTKEMGKVLSSAVSEIEKCGWVCRYYADHAEKFLEREVIGSDASKSFVSYEPLGVILAIMPWNFPFWQVFRFAAPSIMAGNTAVLKHASNVPACALAIEEAFRNSGFPERIFSTLLIGSDAVDKVIENPLIRAVTLTGSVSAGRAVAEKSGKEIKKTVLELGGSDGYLILEDADLDLAAKQGAKSRLLNSGQSCISAKRFVVVEEIYDEWLELFKDYMEQNSIGDPTKQSSDMGPLARKDLRDSLHEQVEKSLENGARCILGGEIPDDKGAYYPPTILVDVKPGMPAYDEELFGPVAAVIKVADEEEGIRVVNDTEFGLGAAVFTADKQRGEKIAEKHLQAGCCFVNEFVKSDPRLPFGGIKNSGYGRELSHHGIREFVNHKTVYIH